MCDAQHSLFNVHQVQLSRTCVGVVLGLHQLHISRRVRIDDFPVIEKIDVLVSSRETCVRRFHHHLSLDLVSSPGLKKSAASLQ